MPTLVLHSRISATQFSVKKVALTGIEPIYQGPKSCVITIILKSNVGKLNYPLKILIASSEI